MSKCKNCGKDYKANGRSLYCSPACKQTFYRNRIPIVTGRNVTIEPGRVTIAKGKCWCCGKTIAPILTCCQECAWSGKAAAKRAGAYPPLLTSRTPDQMHTDLHTLKPTGNYKMTVMGKSKTERTEQIQRIGRDIIMREQADNAIEQHNFSRLVRQGFIVKDRDSLDYEEAGSGKGWQRSAVSTYQSPRY